MSGIEPIEQVEMEMRLIDDETQPRVDYSIRLWADGLLHHITPSGVAIAPLRSEAAIKPDLDSLLAVIKDPDTDKETREIRGEIRKRSIAAAFLASFTLEYDSPFAELLDDPETDVRRAAISGLAGSKLDASAVAPLAVKALNDTDLQARCLAVNALWQCVEESETFLPDLTPAKPALMEMFKLEYDDYREWEIQIRVSDLSEQILARLAQHDPAVVDAMVEALKDKKTRLQAMQVLWAIGSLPEEAVSVFTAALEDENMEWRAYAAFSLWRFGVDGGNAFIDLLRGTENVDVSMAAARLLDADYEPLLNGIESENALPALKAILSERKTDARVWSHAAFALGRFCSRGDDESSRRSLISILPSLLELLNYDDRHARSNAAKALGEMGSDAESATSTLLAIVRDPNENEYLREDAAEALIKIGLDAETVLSLFDLLRRENDFCLYSKAIPMIELLGDQAAPVLVKTLMAIDSDDEADVGFDYKAFELLGRIGAPALPGLIELLKSERWSGLALRTLGKAGTAAVPTLLDILKDGETEERADAAEALGEIGADAADAIPALSAALNDSDLEVCARAAEALGRIGPASGSILIEAVKDADSFTLCWVTKALGEIGAEAEAAIPSLIKLRFHSNPTVSYLAAEALRKIDQAEEPA